MDYMVTMVSVQAMSAEFNLQVGDGMYIPGAFGRLVYSSCGMVELYNRPVEWGVHSFLSM